MKTVEALLSQHPVWLRTEAGSDPCVLSSVARLSRNLATGPFPNRADRATRRRVRDELLALGRGLSFARSGLVTPLDELAEVERQILVERQLLSPERAAAPDEAAVLVGPDERRSMRIHDDDHLLLQAIEPGRATAAVLEMAEALERQVAERAEFAWSERYGFLTARPGLAGTGLRMLVRVHLAGLILDGSLEAALGNLDRTQVHVHGLRGEATGAADGFFEIANARTMGLLETQIQQNLEQALGTLLEAEQRARERLLTRARSLLEDRVWRALGTLEHARLLAPQEVLHHASILRLGASLELVPVPWSVLNEILALGQEAHTRRLSGVGDGDGDAARRVWRATQVREKLQGANGQ